MIVDRALVVSTRKKAEIIADLRRHKFRDFPKSIGAKAPGGIEPAAEDDEDESDAQGSSFDFDCLLGMAIWRVTKEKVDKLTPT